MSFGLASARNVRSFSVVCFRILKVSFVENHGQYLAIATERDLIESLYRVVCPNIDEFAEASCRKLSFVRSATTNY